MNGWHLSEEKLPERGQRIVVIRSDGLPFAGEYCDRLDYGRCIDRASGKFHYGWDLWMPLPSNDTPASTGAELVACDCGDLYPPDSFGAGFIAARGECPNCDAGKSPAQDEAVRRDAERYRWLREEGDSCQWMNIIRVDPDDFESLDAAVDAALAQQRVKEES